jgi:hypothetical protein
LTGVSLVLVYAVLRIGTRSLGIALVGIAVVLSVRILTTGEPHLHFPSTGPLRFLVPWLAVLIGVAAAAWPRYRRAWLVAGAATAALAAVWSLEAFVYTGAALAALLLFDATIGTDPRNERFRRAVRAAAVIGASALASLAALSLVTALAAGDWPDWAGYLSYVARYGVESFGALPAAAWSPAFLVGGAYFASAAALAVVAIERPSVDDDDRVAFAGIAACTGFGIASLTYFVGRSHPNALRHLAPQVIVVLALWAVVLRRRAPRLAPAARLAVVAAVVWLAAAAVSYDPGWTRYWLSHSAAGHLVDRSPTLAGRIEDLARAEPADPRVVAAARLLDRHVPPDTDPLVLLDPDRMTQVLVRSDRPNALPIANLFQDDVLEPDRALRRVERRLDETEPGAILLTEADYFAAPTPSNLAERVVAELRRRFRLTELERTPGGLVVARLESRAGDERS